MDETSRSNSLDIVKILLQSLIGMSNIQNLGNSVENPSQIPANIVQNSTNNLKNLTNSNPGNHHPFQALTTIDSNFQQNNIFQ